MPPALWFFRGLQGHSGTLVPIGYVISFLLGEVDQWGVLRVVKEPGVHISRKVKGQAAGADCYCA